MLYLSMSCQEVKIDKNVTFFLLPKLGSTYLIMTILQYVIFYTLITADMLFSKYTSTNQNSFELYQLHCPRTHSRTLHVIK